jgi:CBS domain-containing membrane protein
LKRNVPVSRIMTEGPATVHVHDKLSDARARMTSGGFHHLPVVSGTKVVGMLSSTDILEVSYLYGQDPRAVDAVLDDTHSVESLMTPNVHTIDQHEPIRRAFELLSEGAYHALPVVDGEALVGIVTSTDLLRYALEQY